jgi:probable O-glycosylation ligase (exosortase A-associated)
MRDISITLIILGSLPLILRSPIIGIYFWSWLSYMNPHRLCWGFAVNMPFAQLVALATLVGLLVTREDKSLPRTRETVTLGLFIAWMFVTTLFALNPEGAWMEWNKVWKIEVMTFATMLVTKSLKRIETLIWIIVLSIGYFGVKGGIFTMLTGGGYKVWGPESSFIGGNNEIGLALIMTIPLMRYLQMNSGRVWVKLGFWAALPLCAASILGTQSRGALIGIVAMGIFLVLKGKNRIPFGLVSLAGAVVLYEFMPDSWHERMATIKTYEKDGSAMGRINAWGFAVNVAKDRLVGGGFETFRGYLFDIYAPNPNDFHDAHSIYFEVLGEHGFIGLGLFLALAFFTWRSASALIDTSQNYPELRKIKDLMRMIQVSLVGYLVSGAFLGLAYFDFYYHLVAVVVMSGQVVKKHVAALPAARTAPVRDTDGFVRRPVKSP